MGNPVFSEMMVKDLIPMIDSTYRTLPTRRPPITACSQMRSLSTTGSSCST